MADHVCAQCESNARANEAGGYKDLAAECRAYCRRGHMSKEDHALRQRAMDYAHSRIVNLGRPTIEWTDDKLVEAIALAFRAGYGAGHADGGKRRG